MKHRHTGLSEDTESFTSWDQEHPAHCLGPTNAVSGTTSWSFVQGSSTTEVFPVFHGSLDVPFTATETTLADDVDGHSYEWWTKRYEVPTPGPHPRTPALTFTLEGWSGTTVLGQVTRHRSERGRVCRTDVVFHDTVFSVNTPPEN